MPDTADLLDLQLGEPVTHRGVCVTPLFPRRDPRADYITLEEAIPLGLRVSEVHDAGTVPELRVVNPTDHRVLLYDGEELLGAKQNRILDVTVLVEARSEPVIPVSCVEQGRWSRRSATFAPAPHASHPELRRLKAERLLDAPAEARGAAQGEVWAAVAAKASRLGSRSDTAANADAFRSRADEVDGLARRFPLQPGQCGAVLALAGAPVCMDVLSRPDAFGRMYPKLLAGYMLDAIEALDGEDTDAKRIAFFVGTTSVSTPTRRPGVALGENLAFRNAAVTGTGLALDGEVLQLSAYPGGGRRSPGRMARPSVRRGD